MANLVELLNKQFGYKEFRPGQEEIITSVLQGRNVLGILPTGAGKTLCYHLPAKVLHGITIVVSPLLSLMEDQVHQLRALGDKSVTQLNGLMTFDEKRNVLSQLHEGSLLFLSPEMLSNNYVLMVLKRFSIGLFVVDEAHCISQWGHEFRTDYLRLMDIIKELNYPPCLALTATATQQVEKDIVQRLNIDDPVVHRFSVNRENIKYFTVEAETQEEKYNLFIKYVEKIKKPAIIYTSTRQEAVRISEELRSHGYGNVAYYHGGMVKEDRLLVQHQFLNNELDYICSTNAFGMGINKPNVRSIIHLHLPSSLEQYVQEVGRAGRDGKDSVALLLFTKDDRNIPLSFIDKEFPTEKELAVWFQTIQGASNNNHLKISFIQNMFQIEETQWRMVVYYLEQAKAIQNDEIIIEKISNELLQKLMLHFTTRKQKKISHFLQFENILTSNECFRENILHYFGEKLYKKPENCCAACGLSLNDIVLSENMPTHSNGNFRTNSWQEELTSLLLPHWRKKYEE